MILGGDLAQDDSETAYKYIARAFINWHGHVHQQFEARCGQARIMGTPSTCIQFRPDCDNFELDDKSPGYRWLQLNDDGSIETGVERIEGFIPTDLSDNTSY